MVDPIFFLFIGITVLSFGIQGSLMVIYARQLDALIVAVYRGLSVGITMLPLLFFSPVAEIWEITAHIPMLLLASSTGALAYISALSAARYLPVGVANSIRQAVYVLGAVILGALFFQEYLSSAQLLLLGGIVGSAIALTLLRTNQPHLDPTAAWRGILFCLVAGVNAAFTFYFFSVLSREINPYVASYFWELTIGLFAFAYLMLLLVLGKYDANPWLPIRQAGSIIFISLLTISATLCYAFAVHYGPYALASGLVTTTILIITLAGRYLFNERLSRAQIGLILFTVAMMFLLKVVS